MKEHEIKLLDLTTIVTKEEVAVNIEHAVASGRYEPAKLGVVLRRMKDGIEEALKIPSVSEAIRNDTVRYIEKGKTAVIFGAKVTEQSVYTTYDFTVCEDPLYNRLVQLKKEIDEKLKLREDFLKLLLKEYESQANKGGLKVVNVDKEEIVGKLPILSEEQSDEVATIKPPLKYQKMGLKYSNL